MLGAACYELAVALGLISLDPSSGEGPAGDGLVLAAALLALVVGCALTATLAARSPALSGGPAMLLAPAAAAFLSARFYSYDPYYAPTLRRMSEGGLVPSGWVFFLVGVALLASVLVRLEPRAGMALTASVLPVCALTALLASAGH